jgi:malate synthase
MEDAATAEISRTQVWQWLHKSCYRRWKNFYMTLYKDILMMSRKIITEFGEENIKTASLN